MITNIIVQGLYEDYVGGNTDVQGKGFRVQFHGPPKKLRKTAVLFRKVLMGGSHVAKSSGE